MSEKLGRYWIRALRFQGGLIVDSDGVSSDQESCGECGHNCYEITAELARTVDPYDIKGRVVGDTVHGKIAKLSEGKSAIR